MKIPLSLLLALLPLGLLAQDDNTSPFGKGLLSTQGAISPGLNPDHANGIHLHGTLAYRFHDRFSWRADGFYQVKAGAPYGPYASMFSGFSYHFLQERPLDPYFALQPGLAYTHWADNLNHVGREEESFDPLVSGAAGLKYHAPKLFHILFETRYVHGERLGKWSSVSLSGFRFTFGLGLHLNVLKPFWKR